METIIKDADYFRNLSERTAEEESILTLSDYHSLISVMEDYVLKNRHLGRSFAWHGPIKPGVVLMLQERGFKVKTESCRNEDLTTITW